MELFKLLGTIAIDNQDANNSIDTTSNKASSLGDKLKSGIGTAAKWGAAVAAGASAAAVGLTKMVTNTTAAADEVDKMSAKIGLSKQGYQEWSYVLGQNGMDISSLQMGMKTLVTQMDAAVNGTEASVEMFDKLGLSVTDSTGALKDQETMMNEVIMALAEMPNGTEKARLATELFGRSGSELMPMLNNGSEAIQELTDRSHELGLIMSDETVNAGVVLGDTIDDVKQSFGMLVTNLGASLMPTMQQVCDIVLQNLPMIQGLLAELAPALGNLMATILPILLQLLGEILPIVTQLASMILPMLLSVLEPLLPLLQPLLALLQPFINLLAAVCTPLVNLLNMILPPLIVVIQQMITVITGMLQPAFEVIAGVISTVLNSAFNSIIPAVTKVTDTFKKVKNTVLEIWRGIGEGIKGIVNGVLGTVEGWLNSVINGINAFIQAVNNVIQAVSAFLGGSAQGIPLLNPVALPRLAKGGVLEEGQVGLLEGSGAEAVVPLDQNRKWISAVAADIQKEFGGLGSNSDQVHELKSAFSDFVEALPEMLTDAFASMKFDVNNREFARLVKAVN